MEKPWVQSAPQTKIKQVKIRQSNTRHIKAGLDDNLYKKVEHSDVSSHITGLLDSVYNEQDMMGLDARRAGAATLVHYLGWMIGHTLK